MTQKHFQQQMEILVADFGKDEYTRQRMLDIWAICEDLPDDSFSKIIKHFRFTRPIKYPPLPTHFLEEAHNQRKILREYRTALPRKEEGLMRTENALENIFKELGVTNIQDAVAKRRQSSTK